ncbi:hypothetical protein Rleg9DRAFT_2740 [Rhizobium leguminosarum bv. trifolii WSM597]|uniref:Uncharacterized protein n=1 Tax=Rhizobium leguminosarum bv. trifolii WSM597 TaxID=754764 RepID=I9X545_RHILT|nr:hypothetical protein Rleg9DRAFT_2740 [Rhizobium leguminosarum bv. trifolii WSM597]
MPATEGAAWMLGSSPSMTEGGMSLWSKYSEGFGDGAEKSIRQERPCSAKR